MKDHGKSADLIAALGLLAVMTSTGIAANGFCGGSTVCACGDTVTADRTLDDTDPVVSTGPTDVCTGLFGLKINAGVTLAGGGKTIRGVETADGGGAGIYFNGCGATVQNLTVEGFGNGYYVLGRDCRDAGVCNATSMTTKPNTIQNVTAKNNGSSSAHEGYGIKINNSQCVTVKGVSVLGAGDEGIHLGTSQRVTMAVLPNPYCGPRKVTVQDSYRENIYFLDSSLNTVSDVVSAFPGGCSPSGRNCLGLHVEGGNEFGTGGTSQNNTFRASTFSDYGIKLTGNAISNTIGASGTGNEVQTVRFEFESRRDSSRRPHGNSLANVVVNGNDTECIVFSTVGSGTTKIHPYSNTGSGTLDHCSPEVDTSDTTRDTMPTNDLCGFACLDGACNETESGNDTGVGDTGVAKFRRANQENECP